MKAKFLKWLAFFLLFIVFLWFAIPIKAIGLKVFPAEIKLEVGLGEAVKQEINIENPAPEVALYEVYSDEFGDWLEIAPQSFVLEQGQSKKAIVKLIAREKGIFSTNISVVAKPLSQQRFLANSGIKISFELKVSEKKGMAFLAFLQGFLEKKIPLTYLFYLIGVSILVGVFIFFFRKKMLK